MLDFSSPRLSTSQLPEVLYPLPTCPSLIANKRRRALVFAPINANFTLADA
jgi:hypothetical protein